MCGLWAGARRWFAPVAHVRARAAGVRTWNRGWLHVAGFTRRADPCTAANARTDPAGMPSTLPRCWASTTRYVCAAAALAAVPSHTDTGDTHAIGSGAVSQADRWFEQAMTLMAQGMKGRGPRGESKGSESVVVSRGSFVKAKCVNRRRSRQMCDAGPELTLGRSCIDLSNAGTLTFASRCGRIWRKPKSCI